jgi:predicted permease
MAVRIAIGASRGRIVRQLLIESGVVAILGGALGLVVAEWTLATLLALVPQRDLLPADVPIDRVSLLFTLALSCLAALLCGVVPALQAGRADQGKALRDGARGTSGRPALARRALVVAQLATALVLLVGAGLLGRSFVRLLSVDLGFEPRGLLTTEVTLPAARYADQARVISFYDRLHEALARIPGVKEAALTSILPLTGDNDTSFEVEGRPLPPRDDQEPVAWYRAVSANYMSVLRLPIVDGRDLMPHEAAPGVLVNQTMARRYWPDESPVGHRLRLRRDGPWLAIVGVVQDIRHRGPSASPIVEMFITYDQLPERQMGIVLRADAEAASVARVVARAVQELDPALPVPAVQPLDALLADAVAQPRFISTLLAVFAALALTLAALGLYGLVAWSVAQRTTEFGLRMALGARGADVLRLVMREALALAAVGVIVGVAGALALTRVIGALLFAVSPADPLVFTATVAALAIIVLAAGYIPARRATRVDPMVALRCE